MFTYIDFSDQNGLIPDIKYDRLICWTFVIYMLRTSIAKEK